MTAARTGAAGEPAVAPGTGAGAASAAPARRRGSRVLVWVGLVVAIFATWTIVKYLGGNPWRFPDALGLGIDLFHDPPFRWPFATDLNLPHWWEIGTALVAPVQRGSDQSLIGYLVDAGFYTWWEAALGFVAGALLGLVLATVFVHQRLLERALVPYVVASQTIPIVALAPMIVFAFGPTIVSVVIIATYLTFFPVTIAMIRGLRSPDPRSLELMRSYAASTWHVYRKVRLPASLPYLFTALKIAATASIVGAIIGEGPGGVPDGLGRAIITFNQYYITGPEKLWGAILVSGLVGVGFYLIVRVVELATLRGRPGAAAG